MAGQINLSGWGEANAGNISVNVSALLQTLCASQADIYLVSRSGSRYRDLASDPLPQLVLIFCANQGEQVKPAGGLPTSEWTCHRLLQQRFLATKAEDKVVLHAHPNSVILLSQLDLCANAQLLNRELNKALPEFDLFLPDGVVIVPTLPPGSQALAECSLAAIGTQKALIWQGHGLVCMGKSPDAALDIMQVVEKAATILLGKLMLSRHLQSDSHFVSPGR